MLTGEEWKLVHDPNGEDQLFRIASDPLELQDVRAEHPDVAERLRERLLAEREEHRDRSSADSGPISVDEKTVEEMRSLGYVD